jgi:hypothetical protein
VAGRRAGGYTGGDGWLAWPVVRFAYRGDSARGLLILRPGNSQKLASRRARVRSREIGKGGRPPRARACDPGARAADSGRLRAAHGWAAIGRVRPSCGHPGGPAGGDRARVVPPMPPPALGSLQTTSRARRIFERSTSPDIRAGANRTNHGSPISPVASGRKARSEGRKHPSLPKVRWPGGVTTL